MKLIFCLIILCFICCYSKFSTFRTQKGWSKSVFKGISISGGGTTQDDLPRDFYARLGIKRNATDKHIKEAFRKLALKVTKLLIRNDTVDHSFFSIVPSRQEPQ